MKKAGNILFLHSVLLLYAFSALISKFASSFPFPSPKFVFWYGMIIVLLFVYAILWQQVLKRMKLNFAYANRAITIVWGMLLGNFIFAETITTTMVIGAVVIIFGISLVVKEYE